MSDVEQVENAPSEEPAAGELSTVARGPRRAVLSVLLVAIAAALPVVVSDPGWQTVMLLVLINACGALGLTLLFGLAGQISLAQASFAGIGAYAPAIVAVHLGLNPWWGLPVGIIVALITAVIIGVPVLRLEGLHLAIATAALAVIFVVVVTQLPSLTGGAPGLAGLTPLSFFGVRMNQPDQLYYAVLAALVVLYVLTIGLVRSPIGKMFLAIGHDSRAAGIAGIRVPSLKVKVFALSAAFAAVSGFFLAEYLLVVVPESFDLIPALLFLVMVVVGGSRALMGAVVGAAFITVVPVLIPQYPRVQETLFAVAFLLAVMFVPDGLVGQRTLASIRSLFERLISRNEKRGETEVVSEK